MITENKQSKQSKQSNQSLLKQHTQMPKCIVGTINNILVFSFLFCFVLFVISRNFAKSIQNNKNKNRDQTGIRSPFSFLTPGPTACTIPCAISSFDAESGKNKPLADIFGG